MSGQEARFQGLGVGPGIARGIVFIHHPDDEEPPKRRIDESDIANEIGGDPPFGEPPAVV